MSFSKGTWEDYVKDVDGVRDSVDQSVLGFLNSEERPSNFEGVFEVWTKYNQAVNQGLGSQLETIPLLMNNIGRQFLKGKLRPGSAKFWQDPITFNGNKVYQRNDLINSSRVDSRTGMTNLELMRSGRAPIGADGNAINLHHLTQRQKGGIAEMTQTFHQQNSKIIHINSNKIPSGINRSEFGKWRSDYWKSRANDF